MRGVNERIITIVGGENHVLQAVGRILKKCLEDPLFEEYRTQSLANNGTSSLVGGMQVRARTQTELRTRAFTYAPIQRTASCARHVLHVHVLCLSRAEAATAG